MNEKLSGDVRQRLNWNESEPLPKKSSGDRINADRKSNVKSKRIMNRLRQEQIDIPVIAIGGIGVEDVALLLDAGLAGVAFSGMLVHAEDPKGLVEALIKVAN